MKKFFKVIKWILILLGILFIALMVYIFVSPNHEQLTSDVKKEAEQIESNVENELDKNKTDNTQNDKSQTDSSKQTDSKTESKSTNTDSTKSTSTDPDAEKINETIAYGDYSVSADSFKIDGDDLTITLTVTNDSTEGRNISGIMGTNAEQAGVVLSQENNAYNGSNERALGELVDPGTSRTIDLKYKLENPDDIFDMLIFNDSSLKLEESNTQMELEIDPVNNTCETTKS